MEIISTRQACFGTVDFWRSAAKHFGCRQWRETMRRFAIQHGKAIAMQGDDSAVIYSRDETKKAGVTITTIPAGAVKWVHA